MTRPLQLPDTETMRAWRQHLHENPELGFEETQTSAFVAEKLESFGFEVHRGIGTTGVVGVMRLGEGNAGPRIGLRADMDALPITEATGLPYASRNPGVMHACGHDGHTTMLLGAAELMARRRAAGELTGEGVITLIFQPAEELGGGDSGARRMLTDGIFRDFPCDVLFGLHNAPNLPEGTFGLRQGTAFCASAYAKLTFHGESSHGASPHLARDATLPLSATLLAMQSIVAQGVETGVIATIATGTVQAGRTFNVIPQEATAELSLRSYDDATMAFLHRRLTEVAEAQAQAWGCRVTVDIRETNPATVNAAEPSARAAAVAARVVGEDQVRHDVPPVIASEDFAHFARQIPSAYLLIGNGASGHRDGKPVGTVSPHNPAYDFNDAILGQGAEFWASLAADYLRTDAA
ncbi:amidohydrolase [Cereibacter sphaeroides]|nr:amidohydrolase [Cereibacter sphaeroides]